MTAVFVTFAACTEGLAACMPRASSGLNPAARDNSGLRMFLKPRGTDVLEPVVPRARLPWLRPVMGGARTWPRRSTLRAESKSRLPPLLTMSRSSGRQRG